VNVLHRIRILLTGLIRRPVRTGERATLHASRRMRSRRGARLSIFLFPAFVLVAHGVVLLLLSDPRVRDPEYGRRAARLRERLQENPGRPLVVVLGSSRTAMGVRAAEWEEIRPNDSARPDPLIFNMAVLGSGPMMELMALRRIYADGFRPDVVLLEYWPPFFHYDGGWDETNRVAENRLMDCDRELVRNYFPDPARIEREMDWQRINTIYANRERLLGILSPNWLPATRRSEAGWTNLDPWGWIPGFDMKPDQTEWRTKAVANCASIYKPVFDQYRFSATAEHAMRESVALAREHGATVGFIYLPESSEFRKLYPPRVEQVATNRLAKMSHELSVPVLNCRLWMPDTAVVDGFHLSRSGAAEFSRRLGPAIAGMFSSGATP
jgi:hypothetical protein